MWKTWVCIEVGGIYSRGVKIFMIKKRYWIERRTTVPSSENTSQFTILQSDYMKRSLKWILAASEAILSSIR